MKAVVLESKDNKCIVLAEDGSMHTIPAAFEVGAEFELDPYLRKRVSTGGVRKRLVAVAAAFIFAIFGSFYYTTFTVSATVTTDGDAPIIYYLNHRGQVLRAEPQNKAAKKVLKDMGGIDSRPPIEEVMEKAEVSLKKNGFLDKKESLEYEIKEGKEPRKPVTTQEDKPAQDKPAREETKKDSEPAQNKPAQENTQKDNKPAQGNKQESKPARENKQNEKQDNKQNNKPAQENKQENKQDNNQNNKPAQDNKQNKEPEKKTEQKAQPGQGGDKENKPDNKPPQEQAQQSLE